MQKLFVVTAVFVLMCLGVGQAVTLDMVTVGNPGNAADTRYATPGFGSVGYEFRIGKYEITAAQYTEFLNYKASVSDDHGLYNSLMWSYSSGCKIQRSGSPGSYTYIVASDYANRPVNFVSYWDSLRFANWMNNGQGSGDTETGAYILGGYTGTDGRTIQRNSGAKWVLTSENEWYKAAYYKGGGTSAGYWDYPTKSDSAPANQVLSTDPGNSANYRIVDYSIGSPYYRTNVGEFENSASAYGTYDQAGNVYEWNEAIVWQNATYACRGIRGGFFGDYGDYLIASGRGYDSPADESNGLGFRLAVVPEPSSLIALVGGLGMLLGMRRRRV